MPSLVRIPAAAYASTAGGNPSQARRREDVDEHLSGNHNNPGKKQSAIEASLDEPNHDAYMHDTIVPKGAGPRKRRADQLGEEDIAAAASASDGTSPRKKAAQAVDWRVQRIVRDLGRLDVLRRGDVGPDVVSDDEDETALDILVRKLVEDADEDAGHIPPPADDDGDDEYFGDIGGGEDGDDYGGGAMAVGGGHLDDDFMPAAQEHYHGDEDANSIAVVTHDDDNSMAITADASNGDGEAEVVDLVSANEDEGPSPENAERPSAKDTANIHVPTSAVTSADVKLPPTDVNYNHGARNPLNDPTAQPVFQPGDDDILNPMRCLFHRQLEWFEATSKDVADRKGRKNAPIVLGQVGFRCVHCAHIPFTKRTIAAVIYPSDCTNGMRRALNRYQSQHFMFCKEIPSNIKSHSKSLSFRQGKRGKQHWAHLMNVFQSIGIIEKDGHLVYDKGSTSAARVLDSGDVIGSDGSEEGYWLCDKCQSVKFANFEEACAHEDTCRGTVAQPDFDGLGQSDNMLLHTPDTLHRLDSTNQREEAYVLSLCCECNQVEDPSSDVPMLLCDGCDSTTHLTCAKDVPKLTEVPKGEWYCHNCALGNRFKEKRLSEDRAINTASTAIGAVLEDNFCTIADKGTKRRPKRRLGHNLDVIFEKIPGIQSKFKPKVPGRKRIRLCVVMGCTRKADSSKRYMCRSHFSRVILLEKIQTMPNGKRRFPCTARDPSLPREHETAYVAVPPNAKHGARVKCSNAVCRSRGHNRLYGEMYRYCALCDIIIEKNSFYHGHKHENELAVEENEEQANVTAAAVVAAEDDEILYGFDSIRGHSKDRKRKGEYLFRVKWKNGEITSEPDTYLKEDDPASFIAYLKSSGLAKTKKYAWSNAEEHV